MPDATGTDPWANTAPPDRRFKLSHLTPGERVEHRRQQMRDAKARYKERHPERAREQDKKHQRGYYQRNRDEIRLAVKLRTYGLTREEYKTMQAEQAGMCAICERDMDERGGENVDHCHETGRVRALLCNGCNGGMGLFGDDPDNLRRAADYLEVHRASA